MRAVRYVSGNGQGGALRLRALLTAGGALLSCFACGSDSWSSGNGNYFLNGRVLDASSQQPLADAQLVLNVGEASKTIRSGADGSFTMGPIAPDSDYRISAKLDGYDPFMFNGASLPHLDASTDRDRGLVGDVQLYPTGGTTPAFKVSARSSNETLPLDESSAEVRFVPRQLGVDPAQRAAVAAAAAAAAAGGANPGTEDFSNTFLPNSAISEVPPYRAQLVNGAVSIPAGALTWGAGYNLEVYGGPSFDTERMQFASGQAANTSVLLNPSPTALATGLNASEYFTGRIYDGVSLGRLTDYQISLTYFDRVIPGTVDEAGRYFVGPLQANSDYTIEVDANGYRSFLSHNARISDTADPSVSSLYYDAFLYPQSMTTPGAVCRVRLSDSTTLPSGTLRLEPQSSSSLFDAASETPVGVTATDTGRQLWQNDEDLQQRTLSFDFTNGEVDIPSGQLVYGVNYAVTIYGVDGHQDKTGSFTAGVDGDVSWVLNPLSVSPLAVTALSTDSLTPTPSGQLVIRFNQPIALDPTVNQTTIQRGLNDNFSISSPDKDQDNVRNTLVDANNVTPPVPAGYRGVSFQIDSDTLTLSWDSTTGLATTDTDDPINSVTYGGLGSVMLYVVGQQSPTPVTLSSLLGSGSSTVQLVAQ